jgi:hypothetical protein
LAANWQFGRWRLANGKMVIVLVYQFAIFLFKNGGMEKNSYLLVEKALGCMYDSTLHFFPYLIG